VAYVFVTLKREHEALSFQFSLAMSSRNNSYIVSSSKITERMRRIKSKGTGLEHAMEQILRRAHLKFKRQPKMLGHPDFQIRGTNILVFCDSSFWHGRCQKELDGRAFTINKNLWMEKLQYNKKRDARISRLLRQQSWSVQRFWDIDILNNPNKVESRLKRVFINSEDKSKNDQAKRD